MAAQPPETITKRRIAANIPQWSLDHPYTVLAFYLGMVVLATWAIFFALPTRMMPYVESPVVGIITMYPGLSAEDIETYISKPIEERMVALDSVHFIRSVSQEDMSVVSIEFFYRTDMRRALLQVQTLMQIAQMDLPYDPANLKPSWVLAIDPLNTPVISFALKGEGWDQVRLRELADNEITNRLKRLEQVESTIVYGGRKRQLQVIVDRNRLASYGLSLADVTRTIDMNTVSPPAGTLTYGEQEARVRMDAKAYKASDMEGYVLTSMEGQPVYLRDVARVEDTYEERRSAYHYNGQERVEVSVVQEPGASSPRVIKRVRDEMQRIKAEYPGLDWDISYDNAHFVQILLRNMAEELILAIVLTGIVVMFFLGNMRATVISMTTIPICLGMAMVGMVPLKLSLNSSTLVGLVLSIGRLVDDSIVDIHAVQRHLKMGKSPARAAVEGTMEIRIAVMAATFMLCLALAPLLFTGGITQDMFVGIVWPIILGLLASLIISFTLTPLMAAHILRPQAVEDARARNLFERIALDPFQRFLRRVEGGYRRALTWSLNHRLLVMSLALGTIIIGISMYPLLGQEMMPIADVGQTYGQLEMSPGTSLAKTEQATYQVEKILMKQPEVRRVSTEIGFESMGTYFTGYAMGRVSTASFMVTLSDMDERKRDIWQVIDAVQKQALATIPGIKRLAFKEMGSDVMATAAAPIQLIAYGKEFDTLSQIGDGMLKIAQRTSDIAQPSLSWFLTMPEYHIQVDRTKAQELGLSPADVARQAYYAMRGARPMEFFRPPNIRQRWILVRYEEEQRAGPEDLGLTTITAMNGEQVPLKSVADVVYRPGPTVIEHDTMRRVISLLGYYRRGGPGEMALIDGVMMQAMMELKFPPGYGLEMRGDMTQMMDSFARLVRGLEMAVIFIFLILIAQFRGFAQPLNMVLSLPLELSGIFGALLITGHTISTVSILAIIILTGMDISVAVLLIDLILTMREQGVPRDQAILRAGPIRLIPILMTSLITIVVLVPVGFFPRTGIDAYAPLAVVVIGGLTVGTFLSLFVIPCLHTYVDDLIHAVRRRLGLGPIYASETPRSE